MGHKSANQAVYASEKTIRQCPIAAECHTRQFEGGKGKAVTENDNRHCYNVGLLKSVWCKKNPSLPIDIIIIIIIIV